jgi:hypothetical protein
MGVMNSQVLFNVIVGVSGFLGGWPLIVSPPLPWVQP